MRIKELIDRSKNAKMPDKKMINKKYSNENFNYTIRDIMNGTIKIRYYGGPKKGWMWFPFLLKHCVKCSEPLFMASNPVAKISDSICNNLKCRESDTGWYIDSNPQNHTYGYMTKTVYQEVKFGKYKGNMRRTKIFQHRWVMEQLVGKEALIDMHVHHIDMNKLNNDISNLWLCTRADHMSAHHSFNKCCAKAFKRPVQFGFNVETGKYYLINNKQHEKEKKTC